MSGDAAQGETAPAIVGLLQVYSVTFNGHWPVGASAIVVAVDELAARVMFDKVLAIEGLHGDRHCDFVLVDTSQPGAGIILNGDY